MPTLIATPKATNANVYVDLATADTHLTENRLYVTEWSAATQATQETALIWATAILDFSMDWNGTKRTVEQALRWPRWGVVDADENQLDPETIPVILERATAELALYLIQKDRTAEPKLLGQAFSRIRAGPIDVSVNKLDILQVVPNYVLLMLAPLGSLKDQALSGDRTVTLIRT